MSGGEGATRHNLLLNRICAFGPLGVLVAKAIRSASRLIRRWTARAYTFRRVDPGDAPYPDTRQILNLLNYTKTSGKSYSGDAFPAGYHSLEINGLQLTGQRHPKERLNRVPFDFTGKAVLDLGCNQGGMLFALAGKIAHGVGIDYDSRVINAANRISSYMGAHNLDFYTLDFDRDDLNLVKDFLPRGRADIVFLLAVCMWLKNWRCVIALATEVADTLLFESNGREEEQQEQVAYLRNRFKSVELLSDRSCDDRSQPARRLYLCRKGVQYGHV
jgi:SAM-dependent methyltransferase